MRSRIPPWFAVVLVLMVIGIVDSLMHGAATSLIIPLTLVAVVFLLYKFPPMRWRKPPHRGYTPGQGRRDASRSSSAKPPKQRRASPFTVIDGRKNKDDEPPRYH